MRRIHRLVLAASLVVSSAASAQDFVPRRWLLRGPLPADTGDAGVTRDYLGGEAAALPDAGLAAAGGPWTEYDADSTGRINFNRAFTSPPEWSIAYGHVYLFAPDAMTALLVLDSDDDIAARLNGQGVWVNIVPRGVGAGRDTVIVRLAAGWNSLLVKVRNRGGGFDQLVRVARALGEAPLEGLRSQVARPAELARGHNLPGATAILSPLSLEGELVWNGAALDAVATVSVSAWGPAALMTAVSFAQGTQRWPGEAALHIEPGSHDALHLRLPAAALRRAALDVEPLSGTASWTGGTRTARLAVDSDGLLRLLGGPIGIAWAVDSSAPARRFTARLAVPAELAGRSVDLNAAELGAASRFTINGRAAQWHAGLVELCAPCLAGDTLSLAVTGEPGRGRVAPRARVREAGYREYADGYRYARVLAGRDPAIRRPDAREWLAALGDGAATARLVAEYDAAYAPLAAQVRRDTLHLVGNSHIDAAWLWPWSETIDVIRRTWRSSLRIGQAFPGYVFAASASAYFDAMDRLEPALAESLTTAVRNGTFALVGGFWVEPDQNVPSGETLARQGLYGQRYFQQRFGRRARTGWTPDSFGYPWTLPQIYRGVGLESFVTQKIRWNDSTQLPYNAFYWEGRDGTRLFTYNPYGYDHDLDPATLARQRVDDRTRPGTTRHMIVLYGVGDHGGGPTMDMLRNAEDARRIPTFPVMRYDNPDNAVAEMRGSAPDSAFPVWRDELYLEYHRGTFTSQAAQKARMRRSETLLRTAEALAAFDTAAYPRARLTGAWHRVLFNAFHDILPGSSIHQVYEDSRLTYDTAWAMIDSVSGPAFAGLRARLDTRPPRRGLTPLVVFNPLTWTRSAAAAAGDSAGAWVPDVPALGARVVFRDARGQVVDERGRSLASRLAEPRAGANWIENAFLRVEVDTTTGAITRIYDKRTGREILAQGARGNVLTVFDDRPANWDAWDIGYTGQQWTVDSVTGRRFSGDGHEARYEITRRWGHSTFTQTLVLSRTEPVLDVRNSVDWAERRKLLKVGFTLATAPDSLTCEIPYGTIGRTGRPRTQAERAKYEFPCQRWVDVSDSTGGAALFTDSKYGWDWHGNTARLSLLRAPVWPDSLADRGHHEFRFAVYPHAGDWRVAEVERRAAEYNTPVIAAAEPAHAGELGRAVSFGSVDAPNVELTWVKRAEDSDALVLRLVEWHGRPATATVTLRDTVRSARRANLLEDAGEPVTASGHTITVTLRPYEIATILVDTGR